MNMLSMELNDTVSASFDALALWFLGKRGKCLDYLASADRLKIDKIDRVLSHKK